MSYRVEQGSRPGNGHGQNILDKHNLLTKRLFEHRRTRDPMVRENHSQTSVRNPSLQHQRLSDDKQAAKNTVVTDKWSSILCDTTLDLTKCILCFRASVLSSLGWRGRHVSFWMRLHRMGHHCVKQHNTNPVSTFRLQKHRKNGWSLRASRRHAHRCKIASLS